MLTNAERQNFENMILSGSCDGNISDNELFYFDHRKLDKSYYANIDLKLIGTFNPVHEHVFTSSEALEINIAEFLTPHGKKNGPFIELKPKSDVDINTLTDKRFKVIFSPNVNIFIMKDHWDALLSGGQYNISIFTKFDLNVLHLFRRIHIAHPMFHNTILGLMLRKHNPGFIGKIVNDYKKSS